MSLMLHNLKATGLDLSSEVRSYVALKLGLLDKLLEGEESRADVELEYLESEEKSYRAELMVHDGALFRATARGKSLHEAIDLSIEELRREISKQKKKNVRMLRHGALRLKEFVRGWRRRP